MPVTGFKRLFSQTHLTVVDSFIVPGQHFSYQACTKLEDHFLSESKWSNTRIEVTAGFLLRTIINDTKRRHRSLRPAGTKPVRNGVHSFELSSRSVAL